MCRLVELKGYADTLSELINELAGEADQILGDPGGRCAELEEIEQAEER
jgi:hypothetical protein